MIVNVRFLMFVLHKQLKNRLYSLEASLRIIHLFIYYWLIIHEKQICGLKFDLEPNYEGILLRLTLHFICFSCTTLINVME